MKRFGWSKQLCSPKCLLRKGLSFGDGLSYAISVGVSPSSCPVQSRRWCREKVDTFNRKREVLLYAYFAGDVTKRCRCAFVIGCNGKVGSIWVRRLGLSYKLCTSGLYRKITVRTT